MDDRAPVPEVAAVVRSPGRRAIRVGRAMVVGSVLLIVCCLAYGLYFAKRAGDAVVFEMPGTVAKELSAGSAAIYTEVRGGTQVTPHEEAYTVTGPAPVEVIVFGFYTDPSQIRVDGTTYELAAKLEVPQDGTYEITVAEDGVDGSEPAVLGRYTDSESWWVLMALLSYLFGLIGLAGLVVLLVGVVRRRRARRATPAAG